MTIHNVVLQGGGVGAIAYAGFIHKACELGILNLTDIKAIAGTSSGAIAALQLALHYSTEEIFQSLQQSDFSVLIKEMQLSNRFDLYTQTGKYKSEPLYLYIENTIKHKIDNAEITFGELSKNNCKQLYVVATRLVRMNGGIEKQEMIFSAKHTPRAKIIDAVRASTSLPIIFPPVRLLKTEDNEYIISAEGEVYIDGGLINNFPIKIFADSANTLGLRLSINSHISPHTSATITTDFEYASALFTLLKSGNTPEIIDVNNSVIIDTLGIPSTQFNLTTEQMIALVHSGEAAAIKLKGHIKC